MHFALPESAEKVLEILEASGALSSRELSLKSRMPERTIRYALRILKEKGFVEEIYLLGDTRKRRYKLKAARDALCFV
ncbi:hypothetical protein DRN43_03675 [Thermococci archaeon]|nr:MAG: hypothetical protein DRN43_03675 [Thermococci archaeon]